MKYIATIFLAIALLSAHAMRDESEEDGLADEEAISRIVLDSTLSEALANLRAKRARGRTMFCNDRTPLKTEDLPDIWATQLDFKSAECVGAGAYGRVFVVKAQCDPTFTLAIKEQNFEKSGNEATAKATMENETQVMRSIKDAQVSNSTTKDRHIVRHHDDVLVGSYGYILMEALPGGELYDTLLPAHRVSLPDKLALFAEALSGVVRIHELGFAHRDLKPENIFLTAKCTTGNCHAKVGDFGYACKPEPNGFCKGSPGTPHYAAPEVLREESGQKSDVWSMGIILYKVLHGFRETPVIPCKEGHKWFRSEYPKIDLRDNEMPRQGRVKYILKCLRSPKNITIPAEAQQTEEGKSFKELLLSMLQKDPAERCTAQKALEDFKVAAEKIGLKERILVDYADTAALPRCMWYPKQAAKPYGDERRARFSNSFWKGA